METILTIVHIVVAVFMIGVVLLQAGKGSGMGALGGGASQAAFGASSGMTFMGKLTAGAAAVFWRSRACWRWRRPPHWRSAGRSGCRGCRSSPTG